MIPPFGTGGNISGHAWVPMDDHTVMMWEIEWNPLRPITEEERAREYANKGTEGPEGMLPPTSRPGGRWYPRLNASKWLKAARALQESSVTPPGVNAPESYAVRSASMVLPRGESWTLEGKKVWHARTGVPVASL